MIIERLYDADGERINKLFNTYAQNELPYKRMDFARFSELLITDTEKVIKINVVAKEGRGIIGFANGCVKTDGTPIGYITFILVDKAYRGKHVGEQLLQELERLLQAAAKLEKFQITFFNPINMEWCVPNTPEHDHPNAPGIDVAGEGYLFFKNMGYLDTAYQNSFYRSLDRFEISDTIKARIAGLAEKQLSICFADIKKHFGFSELFDNLGNELWRETVLPNLIESDGLPVLIAEHNGKAVGFTGPLYVQSSGRGYFAGIGVHSDYRQYGLGKILFASLCQSLKEMGAGYMTLFTGETNPARNIYESAGFKIVKAWVDMERVIK